MSFSLMIISTISMLWYRNSVIQMLISLELLLISCLMAILSNFMLSSFFSILFFLVMMVSGSVMGLSLLVSMSRTHFSSLSNQIFLLLFDKNTYPYFPNIIF